MDGKRARLAPPTLDRVPRIRRVLPAHVRSSGDRLRRDWAIALGIGWPLVTVASTYEH
jgi:hypothetical protein